MNIINKFKETAISVLPVMGIVLLLGLTIVPLNKLLLARFVTGGFLLIIGLTVFLLGVDLGIQPMGERCGSELTKRKSLPLLLFAAFVIGFIVTAAEPDIQVFGSQVKNIYPFLNKKILTCVIAAGVGIFMLMGLLRTVLNFSLKIFLFVSYLIIFGIAIFCPDSFTAIGFDSGGATTGPMTVPFIMALGLGVSATSSDDKNSFGLTGIASIGPVAAVLIYGVILKKLGFFDLHSEITEASNTIESALATTDSGILYNIFNPFAVTFPSVVKEALISVVPLIGLFILFQIFLLKMTRRQVIRISIGFIYAFIGLSIFLTGVNGGFMQAGAALGEILGKNAANYGGVWYFILIITGLILGAIIVCAEPAVWVLSEQVEQVSGGTIKRKALLIFLSVGTSVAIGLSLWRAVTGFNLKLILIPGYILAMILMLLCPSLFSGIAFDSGGVASGPLTSTFVLSFTLGAASSSGATDSFGVIALVAMMPLIAIQIMGIIFKLKLKKINNGGKNV